jgi:hypothetical protein
LDPPSSSGGEMTFSLSFRTTQRQMVEPTNSEIRGQRSRRWNATPPDNRSRPPDLQ